MLLFLALPILTLSSYPILLFHGMGDACVMPGMKGIKKTFDKTAPTTCIESAAFGLSIGLKSFTSQCTDACDKVKKDFYGQDISVVGLSQGSLIARYIIESCDFGGSVKRYVSIGGPQMGVTKLPHCGSGFMCKYINKIIGFGVYSSMAQKLIGPAGYYRDTNQLDNYRKYSSFLADLNQERNKDEKAKERMLNLEKMVLIMFNKDTMIEPKETAWFQTFKENTNELEKLEDTQMYKEDWLGLKQLDADKKIDRVTFNGDHLQFSLQEIEKYIVPALQ